MRPFIELFAANENINADNIRHICVLVSKGTWQWQYFDSIHNDSIPTTRIHYVK